jgi:hypothetical protein
MDWGAKRHQPVIYFERFANSMHTNFQYRLLSLDGLENPASKFTAHHVPTS